MYGSLGSGELLVVEAAVRGIMSGLMSGLEPIREIIPAGEASRWIVPSAFLGLRGLPSLVPDEFRVRIEDETMFQ